MQKIKNFRTAQILSKDEQKKVTGGTWSCSCSGGQVGSWYYTSTPSVSTMFNDINTYCIYGGSCSSGKTLA